MNEIIEQLIKEAGFSDDFIDDCELRYTQQKFAELIIKDCLELADLFEIDVNQSGLVSSIKNHFGIE